jgi:hypothetical protein
MSAVSFEKASLFLSLPKTLLLICISNWQGCKRAKAEIRSNPESFMKTKPARYW